MNSVNKKLAVKVISSLNPVQFEEQIAEFLFQVESIEYMNLNDNGMRFCAVFIYSAQKIKKNNRKTD